MNFLFIHIYLVMFSIAALKDYLTIQRIKQNGSKVVIWVEKRHVFDVVRSTYERYDANDIKLIKGSEYVETVDTYYHVFGKTQRFQCYDTKKYMSVLMSIFGSQKEVVHRFYRKTYITIPLPRTDEGLLYVRYTKFNSSEFGDDDMQLVVDFSEDKTVLNIFDTRDAVVVLFWLISAPIKCFLFIMNFFF